MNQEVEIAQNEPLIYQAKFENQEISEHKITDEEAAAKTIKADASISAEDRFSRLKRNLRKRSVSIL